MDRLFFALGALFAFLGVAAGAFGAHSLRERLSPAMLDVFETGVRYQMYHAFGLMMIAWAQSRWSGASLNVSGWLFVAGILLFSGSLYLLSVTGIRWLGAVTPFGGLAFLAGWISLALIVWRATPS
ncbi:MAG: membrane protein [Herpetosiphonaceae bacterium]|nr:MAG: membrane protein [Herpetosiphonaceae bacterium]